MRVGDGVRGGRIVGDRRPEAERSDVGAVVRGVNDRVRDRREVHAARAVGNLERHDRTAAGDACGAQPVVVHGGRDAGAGGPVTAARGVVIGIRIVVSVVVARDLAQVGVTGIHSAIDDGDYDGGRSMTLRAVPRRLRAAVETNGAHGGPAGMPSAAPAVVEELRGVVVSPVARVQRIVGHVSREGAIVRRGVLDLGQSTQSTGERFDVGTRIDVGHVPAIEPELGPEPLVLHVDQRALDPGRGCVAQLHVERGDPRCVVSRRSFRPPRAFQGRDRQRVLGDLNQHPTGCVPRDELHRRVRAGLRGHKWGGGLPLLPEGDRREQGQANGGGHDGPACEFRHDSVPSGKGKS